MYVSGSEFKSFSPLLASFEIRRQQRREKCKIFPIATELFGGAPRSDLSFSLSYSVTKFSSLLSAISYFAWIIFRSSGRSETEGINILIKWSTLQILYFSSLHKCKRERYTSDLAMKWSILVLMKVGLNGDWKVCFYCKALAVKLLNLFVQLTILRFVSAWIQSARPCRQTLVCQRCRVLAGWWLVLESPKRDCKSNRDELVFFTAHRPTKEHIVKRIE